jgi:hypothetical protein
MERAYAVPLPGRKKFWKDQLFDFGFPPRVIEIAVSYEFRRGDIISNLFVGKFGPQNQYFADALPPYFCEQTLKRLLALALDEGTDTVLINQLAESLKREGFDVTRTDKLAAQTTGAQTSSTTWLSDSQREILKTVVSRFLETNEPTSRILVVKKVVDPDIVDELTPVLLRNPTVEKLFPTAVAFQCSGDKNALEAAKSAVQLVIDTLKKLYASAGEKVHFSIDQIEEQARLILNTQRRELDSSRDRAAVQLGLYLIQDFRRVHAGMGGVYPNIAHVVVNERIGSINPATAWDEHIEQYSAYLKNRDEKIAVSNESMKSAENPVASTEQVASEKKKHWTRDQKIGIGTLILAALAVIAAVATPEIRQRIGLERKPNAIPLNANSTPDSTTKSPSGTTPEILPLITMRIAPSNFPIPTPPHNEISILALHPFRTLTEGADYLIKFDNDCPEEHFWPTRKEIGSKATKDHEAVLKIEIANHSQQTLTGGKATFKVRYNAASSAGCMPPKDASSDQEDVVLIPPLEQGKSFQFFAVNQTNMCAWLIPPESVSVRMTSDTAERSVTLTFDKSPLYAAGSPAFPPTIVKWEGVPAKRGGYGIIRRVSPCGQTADSPIVPPL